MKFPTFEGINSTYRMEADNADIRKAIVKAVPKATEQIKEMANGFSGFNDQETCKKIFDFLKNQIRYKADGPDQIIRYPSALLKTRVGDCKSYSLLTAAILNNLKIPCRFVLQSFNEDPTPSHIYVETLSGVKIDAVYGKFNSEKPSTFQYTIPMNVKYMSGITGCGCNSRSSNTGCGCNVTAIGSVLIGLTAANRADCDKKHPTKRLFDKGPDLNYLSRQGCYSAKNVQEAADYAKDKAKQAANYIDSLNLKQYFSAPVREIMLGMYRLNIDGLASNVNNSPAKAKLLDKFIRLGGSAQTLDRAIVDGSSKRAIKIGMREAAEKKIREILSKNKIISGVDNTLIREQAKKILSIDSTVGQSYLGSLAGVGAFYGAKLGGIVGTAIPGVGNAAGITTGGTMGTALGYFLFEQTPNLVDGIFPVQGNTGGDTTYQGDPQNEPKKDVVTFDEKGCAFINVAGRKIAFPTGNKPTCTPTPPTPNANDTDGKSNMILPILLGVGVLIALNKR
jgi:hypothetical protein